MPTRQEIRTGFTTTIEANEALLVIAEAAANTSEIARLKMLIRRAKRTRRRWATGQEIVDELSDAWDYLENEPLASLEYQDVVASIALILPTLPTLAWTGNNGRRVLRNRLREIVASVLVDQPVRDLCERIKRTHLVDQQTASGSPLLAYDQEATDPTEIRGDAAVAAIAASTTAVEFDLGADALVSYYENTPDEDEPRVPSPQ